MSLIGKKAKILVKVEKYGLNHDCIQEAGTVGTITGLIKTNGVFSNAEIEFEDGQFSYLKLSELELIEKAPERNVYRYLIEVLQYVIASEHSHFVEKFCKDDSPESIEDAFANVDIQHVYKSAKLAYWDLLDNVDIHPDLKVRGFLSLALHARRGCF